MVAHVLDLGGLQISCPEPTGQRKLEMMHHWCPAVIEAWRPQPADGKVPFLVYQLPSRAPAAAWRDEPVGPAPRQDSERNGLVADVGQRQVWATIRSGLSAGLLQTAELDNNQ